MANPTEHPDGQLPANSKPKADETEKASGTASQPISPGEAQAGDMNEQASNISGPIDIRPGRRGPPRETAEG